MKHKFLLVFLPLSIFFFLAFAPKANADEAYIVHLYYNVKTKALYFDKQQNPVDLDRTQSLGLKEFFDNQDTIKSADYILKILSINEKEETDVMKFDKKAGQFDLRVPYFVGGQTINIYDFKTGEKIASADISSFIVCNGNNICEYEKGENAQNCINDCANEHVVYSEETRKQLKAENGTIKDPQTGSILLQNNSFSSSGTTSSSGTSAKKGTTQATSPQTSRLAYIILAVILALIIIFAAIVYLKKRSGSKKTP